MWGSPTQGEKGSVVRQNLGLVDAPQAGHDGEPQSQDQVAGTIVGTPLRHPERVLKLLTQSELVPKTPQQHHTAEGVT